MIWCQYWRVNYGDPRLTFIRQGMHIFVSSVSISVAWLPTQYTHSLFVLIGIMDEAAGLSENLLVLMDYIN